jgi:hypothetical protein
MFFVAPSVVVWVKEEPHTLEHLLQIPQMTQSAFYLRFGPKNGPNRHSIAACIAKLDAGYPKSDPLTAMRVNYDM